jgi:Protein of unknown function (DUF998)
MRSRPVGEALRSLAYLAGGGAGLLAAVLYDAFLAAGPVGSRLSPVDSFVSELEVPGQPGSNLFRLVDVVCGAAVVTFALALWYRLSRTRTATLGCAFLAASGMCGVLDARYPMPCTPSTDPACRQVVDRVSVVTLLHQPHAATGSLAVFTGIVAMLLLGLAPGVRAWSARLARASLASGILLSALGLLEVALIRAGHGVGAAERIDLLVLSAWLAILAAHLLRDGRLDAVPPARRGLSGRRNGTANGRG